uniref:Uncharacterized protein n=1 Tax=Macrostomum lignano TaxID=282301 RepID=A0A1I8FLH0_9PLAT
MRVSPRAQWEDRSSKGRFSAYIGGVEIVFHCCSGVVSRPRSARACSPSSSR